MADVAAEQASSGHQPEKRKRGRPRKLKTDQSEEPKPKRARGRPKGSKNKKPSKFQEILRPVKYKALLKFKKNKTNSQNSQHKQLKRITENLQAKPAQPENVQTNSSRNLCRINGKFASSKNNSLKNMKNSVTPQISSKYKVDGRSSVISNHSKKRTGPANSKRVKTAVNSKRQTRKKYYSTKKNSNSIQSPNNNQRKRIQSSPKNPTLVNQLQSPVNYRRKSCGLCDQTSVRRHRVTSPKHFCKDLLSSNCRQSSSSLRRSRRIMSICNKFSNSTNGSENTSPSSSVYYSSPEFLMPLRKRRNSRRAHSPHTLLHNVSRLCSSHHHSHATVNNTTSPSSHTTGTTITTTTTTALSCPTTAPLSSTASSSTLSPVSAASTNNLHHPSSFSSQSTPNDSLSEHQTDSFTSTSQPKDVTNAVHIVRSCSQLSPNNCSLKMLKCHRLHHLAAASGDVAAASVVSRHCTATKHLNGKCHAMHMNTQPCLPNISSAVQVAASMISSRISDKSVSIYNHALEKQSGSVCQSYEQLNIVLSPFEKQIFELHRQEHEQRMAMEEERHQMKMNIMRLKKKALERKLKN